MIYSEVRVMRGPNMWSPDHHQIIAVKFDLNAIPDLDVKRQNFIKEYFLQTYNIEALHEGFHLCIFRYTLQLAARLQEKKLQHELVYPTNGILFGTIQYYVEEAGKMALQLASEILVALLAGQVPVALSEATALVRKAEQNNGPGPTTSIIIAAAKARNIPVSEGPAGYTILGYGKNQKLISAAMSHYTSCISVNIAGIKEQTKQFLESAYVPVPKGQLVRDENDLLEVAEELDYPLVTKPFDGNKGRNVTCGIHNFSDLLHGYRHAAEISSAVIVEREIKGEDYRLLVVGHKFIAGSVRLPASVTGDGIHSISELVEIENKNIKRGDGHGSILTKITLDAASELCLQNQGLSASCVPQKGQQVILKLTANLSTGGTAEDVTDLVHPSNKKLAEKVSRIVGLDLCGIDIITPDISQPIVENGGAVIEVNAAPGLRMHQHPSRGIAREVGDPIVDLMFNKEEDGRIPIVAITGTNGKTTTTRLMAHVLSYAGKKVGFSSTDGIYIDGEKVHTGDCSGPQSARSILQDKTIDCAVLECARGGIIRSGLGFDKCDIAIVTNVAADHLGMKDIYTVEDLAFVKVVVPRSVKKTGWAILNASDELAYKMKDQIKSNIAFFSSDAQNEHLVNHIENGGVAVYADHLLDVYISTPDGKMFILNAAEAPITRDGKAGFMVDNLLPVVLAGYFSSIPPLQIAEALKSFMPSADQTPGRINEFKINGVNVIVDYAHNPHGLKALSGYMRNISGRKLGIITGTGDRREEDIIAFGRIAAGMYDDIIIRFDRDLRGRTQEAITELLVRGIHETNPQQAYQIIPDTQTAIHHAIAQAEKGSYVVICADNASYTVELARKVALQFQEMI